VKEQELRLKLKKLAGELGLRVPEVQMLLCQERFIARLASITEGRAFIWKGGSLILRLYRGDGQPRYTIDVDLTVGGISAGAVLEILKRAMRVDLCDGFVFTSIKAQPMERDLPYGGDRFELDWNFFSKQSSRKLKVDACAGDVVEPRFISASEAFLLPIGEENLEFKVYPKEFIFAEKLETIVRFRTGNTRCKDFVNIWVLIQSGLALQHLRRAIDMCFTNRGTVFSMKMLQEVLNDRGFRDRLETHRARHFAELAVPDMGTVMHDILALMRSLDLTS
jgi:hypothetical protein